MVPPVAGLALAISTALQTIDSDDNIRPLEHLN
jgi:hypothetical protein